MPKYNATLTDIRLLHEELGIFRIEVDGGTPAFEPGQFTTLGLLDSEPGVVECLQMGKTDFLHRRAYSISHPVWQEGKLAKPQQVLEFYVVLVKEGKGKLPSLTPRLFALSSGARILVGKIAGHYTLHQEEVEQKRHLVFCATGTGEAPHCAMIWKLLSAGYEGKLTSIICVREQRDLGYRPEFEALAAAYPQFQYHVLTTREPGQPKQYIQDLIQSGSLEEKIGAPLDAEKFGFYLCGNPAMIGIPRRSTEGEWIYPEGNPGVVKLLADRGFKPDQPKMPGNIHYEKYW